MADGVLFKSFNYQTVGSLFPFKLGTLDHLLMAKTALKAIPNYGSILKIPLNFGDEGETHWLKLPCLQV